MTTTEPPTSLVEHGDDRARIRYAPVNGLELAYETFGNPSHPAILLVTSLLLYYVVLRRPGGQRAAQGALQT